MPDTEIPKAKVAAAVKAYETYRAAGASSTDAMREALSAAALPHLRVQETPRWVTIEDDDDSDEAWPSGLSPDNPFLTPQAEYIHVHSNGPDAADCTTCEPPHPRPVVDREALLEALHAKATAVQLDGGYIAVLIAPEDAADAVLALLPTEEPAVYVVHHHDIEKTAEHFNEGYEEAQRQGIGGAESRNWLIEKVWPLLKDHIDPENSHHVADQIADALLSEADLGDLPTEEGEGS